MKAVAEALTGSELLTVREDGMGIKRTKVGTSTNDHL